MFSLSQISYVRYLLSKCFASQHVTYYFQPLQLIPKLGINGSANFGYFEYQIGFYSSNKILPVYLHGSIKHGTILGSVQCHRRSRKQTGTTADVDRVFPAISSCNSASRPRCILLLVKASLV
jgi:hypothetical protein